jgi:integrase
VHVHGRDDVFLETHGFIQPKSVEDYLANSLGLAAEVILNAPDIKKKNPASYLKRKRMVNFLGHVPTLKPSEEPYTKEDFFPLQYISKLIHGASSYRDAALYSLLAATSLRVSEAIQILHKDVDLENRRVYAIDPKSNERDASSYRGLDEVDFNHLSWKGRTTKYTLLLEPYGTMFFEYHALYLKHEYKTSYHNFLFQTKKGDPLFLSDYSSVVYAPFRKVSKSILEGTEYSGFSYTPHSLRHSYCVFFKNFVTHTEGVGLRDSEIKALTGHKSEKIVARYALMKRYLLELKVAFAFVSVEEHSSRSFNEHKLGFLKREYEATMQAVAKEQLERARKEAEVCQ